jgi:hypothetical protein
MDNVFPPTDQNPSDLARDTYGPLSVPLIAPSLFSKHRSLQMRKAMNFAYSAQGYHFISPSVANVSNDPLGRQSNKLVVCGTHDVAIASYLGLDTIIDRVRRPIERMCYNDWVSQQSNLLSTLTFTIPALYDLPLEEDDDLDSGDVRKGGKAAVAADLLYGAKMLADLASAPGLVDLMALDLSCGGLPDEFSNPSGIPLVLAILTRIAAYPGHFRLENGTKNDTWAAREIARAFEENNRPVMTVLGTEWQSSEQNMFAIDIAANLALNNVRQSVCAAIKKAKKGRSMENAILDSEYLDESMELLFNHACSLMIDVAAPTGPDTYTPLFGNANKAVDPIQIKRLEAAQQLYGMGKVGNRGVTTLRCTHRSQRQAKLLGILQMVETWLKDGKVNGIQVSTQNQHNPRAKREKPSKVKQTIHGHVPVLAYSTKLGGGEDFSDLCIDALHIATCQLEQLFHRGPALFFASQPTDVLVFSRRSKLQCANCSQNMDAITAFALSSVTDNCCPRCSRPRCQSCLAASPRLSNCLRCVGDEED